MFLEVVDARAIDRMRREDMKSASNKKPREISAFSTNLNG